MPDVHSIDGDEGEDTLCDDDDEGEEEEEEEEEEPILRGARGPTQLNRFSL